MNIRPSMLALCARMIRGVESTVVAQNGARTDPLRWQWAVSWRPKRRSERNR